MCVVASLWSRRLTFIDLGREAPGDDHPSLKIARTLDLPFSPRTMVQVRDGAKLVVTDAFGGRLAVVDARGRTLDGVRSIPAHNIRGMATAPDGETLVIAHQVLNRLARSSFDDVHWGLMVSNHLRLLRIEALLTHGSDGDLLKGSRLINLGNVGNAAGDPSDVVFDGAGGLIVALAGVDEVAMAPGLGRPLRRTTVGRRPSAVAATPDASRVFVADSLDDTISVVREHGGQVETIPLGPRPELGPVERGERLFSDARISHDGWMSCHSCHTDGHTNGLLNDTLGDGTYGAAKRVPSLLGVGETGPWTWLGGMDRLEDQVRKSIGTTMRGATPSDEQVEALAAYLRSLAPPSPALADAARDDEAAVARGREVFRARECATCHAPPEYASKGRYDVGLVDEMGNRKFNPPSLRGVSRREPLLHDGRARTLEDVFLPHQHPRGMEFTPQEVSDLVAFLKSL
jgi:mono/diheme cytochrome c family protein